MNELTTLSLNELRSGLDRGDFSSVEITQAFLDRIQQAAVLNSFLEVSAEKSLAAAQEADKRLAAGQRASLLGIPLAIKDVILTAGTKTTCASRILSNFIPPYDATVVKKLKQAGAHSLGKTNMDEFAMGSSNENSAFGPCRNPWDLDRISGGSSGGSAVAVAARLCPASLGTDTGGSIRFPAAMCNVVGLKPTYGRVSRYGVIAYASSLDQVGVFASTVRDCALITEIISGHDPLDSTSMQQDIPAWSQMQPDSLKGLRLGIPKEYFIAGIQPEVEAAVRAAITRLESLGASIASISLPHTELAVPCYYVLAPAEASSNLSRYDGVRYGHRAENPESLQDLYFRSRSEGFGKEVKRRIMIGTYVLSTGYYDAYYLHAQKVRTLIAKDFKSAFETQCDLIVCPVAPTTAFKLGEKLEDPVQMYLSDVFTIPVNLAGLPGLSLPCGFDQKGLPIGMQIIGKPFDESSLFRAAYAYQSATDWHLKRPAALKDIQ